MGGGAYYFMGGGGYNGKDPNFVISQFESSLNKIGCNFNLWQTEKSKQQGMILTPNSTFMLALNESGTMTIRLSSAMTTEESFFRIVVTRA